MGLSKIIWNCAKASKDAFCAALKQLKGAYAFGVIIDDNPDEIFCARAGSPLALGVGANGDEHYLGSDAMAMAQLTNQLIYLEEGDWAILRPDGYEVFDENDAPVTRDITIIKGGPALAEKGKYAHFMLKEIYEQEAPKSRKLWTSRNSTGLFLLPAGQPIMQVLSPNIGSNKSQASPLI